MLRSEPVVIALSGRRIDKPDAPERRFPADRVPHVQRELRKALEELGANVLVCSAACGSDLLGLEAAGELDMRRRILLPFDRTQFRKTSVVDRPGNWGALYDSILDDVEASGDLLVLGFESTDPTAYEATNKAILDEAKRVAADHGELLRIVIVWDGASRGQDDVTADFLKLARAASIPITEIKTVSEST